jgi:hypothetical protein
MKRRNSIAYLSLPYSAAKANLEIKLRKSRFRGGVGKRLETTAFDNPVWPLFLSQISGPDLQLSLAS